MPDLTNGLAGAVSRALQTPTICRKPCPCMSPEVPDFRLPDPLISGSVHIPMPKDLCRVRRSDGNWLTCSSRPCTPTRPANSSPYFARTLINTCAYFVAALDPVRGVRRLVGLFLKRSARRSEGQEQESASRGAENVSRERTTFPRRLKR